ncbi:MAG: hypothetical protein IJX53_04865 [Clostridia bacterium]|nr:hypothetical protein [Clostridia bacterium]
MNIKHIANTHGGQDGAIFGKYLFRFNAKGLCRVYDLTLLTAEADTAVDLPLLAEFTLDRAGEIVPHSNAVGFGREFYAEGDEFPLLYSNIYNNYAKAEDKLCGMCCVYRLQRDGTQFSTTLVQLIEIGFADDRDSGLWRSAGETEDVRPYGNFVIDAENGVYYAFVMRDDDRTTRYFAFDLPKLADGETDGRFGVKKVTLTAADIRMQFDTPYHNYIQGACFRSGRIYSVEGFHDRIHPALRVIDAAEKRQVLFFDFFEAGYPLEAEFIDFYAEMCLYSDAKGHVFALDIE